MSSYSNYLSAALTTATNKYTSLRRVLLNDENDGDTEDDSHTCRVLRAYYTEKGRQFPEWLPPDPKAPPPPPPTQFVSSTRLDGYGGMGGQRGSGGGGLSDLWDSSGRAGAPTGPASLRGGRANNMSMDSNVGRNSGGGRPGIVDSYQRAGSAEQVQARPLPSQRAGSYQSSMRSPPADQTPPGSSGGGGSSAQDRLKARLWGGTRSASPSNQSVASSPGVSSVGSRNPYDSSTSSGGYTSSANSPWSGGGGDDYGNYGGGGGGYGSGGGGYGSSGNPYASTNNPAPARAGRGGLPTGPRSGLPSGPRLKR